MALAGVAGLGVGVGSGGFGTARAASSDYLAIDGSNSMNARLDMGGFSVENVDDVLANAQYSSHSTRGNGNDVVQFWDRANGNYLVRAREGGPVSVGQDLVAERGLSVDGWNVVDVGADLDVEPGSDADVAAEIDSFVGSDASANYLFVFPNGTYKWNTTLDKTGFEFLGFVGKPRATLDVTDPDANLLMDLGSDSTDSSRLVVRNLTVDITDRSDGTVIDAKYQDRDSDGSVDHDTDERFSFQVQMAEETGVCFMRNVKQPDGGTFWPEKDAVGHVIPFSSDPKHRGTKIYEQCYVEGFVDNGFYVMNSPGRNVLRGCTAKNNGGGNVRLGVDDVCRDSTIVIDNANSVGYNGAGLWLTGSSDDYEGQQPFAENVRIYGPEAQNDLLRINSGANGATAKNVEIYAGPNSFTNSGFAVDVTEGSSTPDRRILLEDVTVRDEAGDDIVEIREPNATFTNCRFEGSSSKNGRFAAYDAASDGLYVDGCRFVNADLYSLSSSDLTTSGNFGI
ncbi:hypothetical protein BRD15_04870 [Halobacteriales archaeon SW_6_65_15]|nr:MAG: hypothetical protein BRD15_04870 [Halobacteriales archaeon SW_6_65_15]